MRNSPMGATSSGVAACSDKVTATEPRKSVAPPVESKIR
jgi:hypothetical protein